MIIFRICLFVAAATCIAGVSLAAQGPETEKTSASNSERERWLALHREVWSKLSQPAYWEQVATYHCVTSEYMAGLAKGEVTEMAMEYYKIQAAGPGSAFRPAPKCKK